MATKIALQIRQAQIDDIPAVEQLIHKSMLGLGIGAYTRQQVESGLYYMGDVDSQVIRDQTYYIAECEGQIVGSGGWSRRRKSYGGDQMVLTDDSLLDPRYDAAVIRMVFVHPHWARCGIGSRLMQISEQAAYDNGFRQLELTATRSGEPLYVRLGYEVVERFAIDFPDGNCLPVAKMVKSLL